MNSPGENTVHPVRRRSWRFFAQFSLRTLLLTTTVVAIACWWFLRPELREEQLAGKFLTLRRQVHLARDEVEITGELGTRRVPFPWMRNVGSWQLHDDQSNLLVSGRHDRNEPHGWWTTYHPNGRKATQGKMQHGAKVGSWKAWDAAGKLSSSVVYRQPPSDTTESIRHGPTRAWHANGQFKLKGMYHNDRRAGPWTFYNDQGQVTATRQYSQ